MNMDSDACYQALLTHDARFDGAFFVGVSTTGIYCRTVCPAKTPGRDRCTFYRSAAAAEHAGYRPCLRCRPELAPGSASVDAVSRLAANAASRIEDGALTDKSVEELAAEMGMSARHLGRVVQSEFGVSPIELAQTQRLLLSKRLLTDTNLSITDVAFASGFSSLRRFNALFKERYRLNPTDLRKGRTSGITKQTLICETPYHPPLDWDSLLAFLAARVSSGVEMVDGGRYLRTACIGKHSGWISVEPSKGRDSLRVEMSTTLAPAIVQVLARVKRLFDLTAEPRRIAEQLGPLAAAHPGLRVPGSFDGLEMAVRAIIGQQVSVKAATTVASRFANAFGERIETPFEGLTHLTPTAELVARAKAEMICSLGITQARARAIIAMACAVTDGRVVLDYGANVAETIVQLKALPGIGDWTAQYIAMRALSWPDAFLHGDLGVLKALGDNDPKRAVVAGEAWSPWRSYAMMHLWKRLEEKT